MVVWLCAVFRCLWLEYRILYAQRTFPGISFFISGLSGHFRCRPGVFAGVLDFLFFCSASHSHCGVLAIGLVHDCARMRQHKGTARSLRVFALRRPIGMTIYLLGAILRIWL